MLKFAIIITDAMGNNDITEHQTITEGQFIDGIRELLETARNNVVKQVNTTMLMTSGKCHSTHFWSTVAAKVDLMS